MLAITLYSSTALSETQPDLELLEFLADWETESGEWIDPSLLEDGIEEKSTMEVTDEQR